MNIIVDRIPSPTGKGKAYRIAQWRDGACFLDLILSERQAKSLVNRLSKLLPMTPLNVTVSKREVRSVRRDLCTFTLPLSEDINEDGTLRKGAKDPNDLRPPFAIPIAETGFCDPPTTQHRTLPPLEAVVTKKGVKIRRAPRPNLGAPLLPGRIPRA